jgi:hypothetical protein
VSDDAFAVASCVCFENVQEPVFYGRDLGAALAVVRGFQDTRAALASLSDGEAARAVGRLRETLAAHHSDERGVVFDSRSWLITARRRRSPRGDPAEALSHERQFHSGRGGRRARRRAPRAHHGVCMTVRVTALLR